MGQSHTWYTLDGLVRANTTSNPCTGADHATLKLIWLPYLRMF